MVIFLVPVDGSEHSNRTIERVIQQVKWYRDDVEVHLLNVQHAFPLRAASHVGQGRVQAYHREQGLAMLAEARKRLDAAKVKYQFHIGIGEEADVICKYARAKKADQIIMGTRGMGSVSNLLLGSVATKVIHLSKVPVLLVK